MKISKIQSLSSKTSQSRVLGSWQRLWETPGTRVGCLRDRNESCQETSPPPGLPWGKPHCRWFTILGEVLCHHCHRRRNALNSVLSRAADLPPRASLNSCCLLTHSRPLKGISARQKLGHSSHLGCKEVWEM